MIYIRIIEISLLLEYSLVILVSISGARVKSSEEGAGSEQNPGSYRHSIADHIILTQPVSQCPQSRIPPLRIKKKWIQIKRATIFIYKKKEFNYTNTFTLKILSGFNPSEKKLVPVATTASTRVRNSGLQNYSLTLIILG